MRTPKNILSDRFIRHYDSHFDLQHLDTDDQEQIERFLRFQGVQTLFPYMRATISNTLSSAMIAPLTLPIVDVYQLFPEDAKYLPEANN